MDRDVSGMKLTTVLKEWLELEEWEDQIEIREERKLAHVATTVNINNQVHRLFLEVNEEAEQFFVYLYGPITVPPPRTRDTLQILNRVNQRLTLGRFVCLEDTTTIQYMASIDVEGGWLSVEQIGTMVDAASSAFGYYGEVLAAVALTKQSTDALWNDFLQEKEVAAAAAQIT